MSNDELPCVITFGDVREGEVFRQNRTLYRKLPRSEQTAFRNCEPISNRLGGHHFYIDALVIVKGE